MDTILYGGRIYPMTGETATALAIQNGRIAQVGSDAQVLAGKDGNTAMINLQGRCVLPGFCDTHTHMLLTGVGFHRLDLRGVASEEELIERGRAYVEKHTPGPGQWVVGYGFDHNLFPNPVLPGLEAAEAISKEHPVLLDRVCGHVGAANRLALHLAGYTSETVIPGGELDKDEAGRLNGILRETALDQIKTHIPRLTHGQVEAHLEEAGRRFAQAGLCSVHSDDLGPEGTDWDTLRKAVDRLKEKGTHAIRIYEEWEAPTVEALAPILARGAFSGWGDDDLNLCNIKLITDGSLGARTALLREDYSDEAGNRGIAVYTQEALDQLVALCQAHGLQVALHAIGDGAMAQCIQAVEKAQAQNSQRLGHRVVHGQIGDRALYARLADLGMGVDIQPAFTASDAPLVESRLGERGRESYAWKSLLEAGVLLGGGSDSPVESYEPIWGIHCAVNREGGSAGTPWQPQEALTVWEAVSLYTINAARLAAVEDLAGTLETGKLADLVVLDRDIFQIPKTEIKNTKVTLTIMGGNITYQEA